MRAEIRIPTTQYGYINFFVEVEDNGYAEKEIISIHNRIVQKYQDSLKTPSVSLETPLSSGLKPVELLRRLYRIICGQGLTEDDLELFGTEKVYSQRDVLKIVQSLINKSKRDESEGRINKEEDIRYN